MIEIKLIVSETNGIIVTQFIPPPKGVMEQSATESELERVRFLSQILKHCEIEKFGQAEFPEQTKNWTRLDPNPKRE